MNFYLIINSQMKLFSENLIKKFTTFALINSMLVNFLVFK
ncbi:MAG: hypothetical protein BWY47_00511 [Bacteroidetes bacterium ADurb.Bin302]|nr:MAG: hypothetical protein BWY47_00511 [Bacteroidetes bacterium ADurb.Bin302]